MENRERLRRRDMFSIMASGLTAVAAACGPAGAATNVMQTPEGRVLQWEREDMTVLVSGLREEYRSGEQVQISVLLNNSAPVPAVARVRTRLLGRGQQAVVEAEVANVTINSADATRVDRALDLPRSLAAGDYTVQVEIPPWRLERRDVGGGRLTADIRVLPAL